MRLPVNPNVGLGFDESGLRRIVLAGGCFWGTQAYVRRVRGVARTECGYANGTVEDPGYALVCGGMTGHAEAVAVWYDPDMLPLSELLREFFKTINPTSRYRQGGDVGTQYRTGIYFYDETDEPVIRAAVARVQEAYDQPVVTEVEPLTCFYRAEEYHQDYLEKDPNGYCHVDLRKLEE